MQVAALANALNDKNKQLALALCGQCQLDQAGQLIRGLSQQVRIVFGCGKNNGALNAGLNKLAKWLGTVRRNTG